MELTLNNMIQLFLEEEREKELEELYESTLVSQMEKTDVNDMELDSAGKQTMETLKAGERIIEALDLADEEKNGWEAYEAVSVIIMECYFFSLLIYIII